LTTEHCTRGKLN